MTCECSNEAVRAEWIEPANKLSRAIENGSVLDDIDCFYLPCKCIIGALLRRHSPEPNDIRKLVESRQWPLENCLAISLSHQCEDISDWDISGYRKLVAQAVINDNSCIRMRKSARSCVPQT